MGLKKAREYNPPQFFDDLKRVSEVMVYAKCSEVFLKTTKIQVLNMAETNTVEYYITDKIFTIPRDVMVIL